MDDNTLKATSMVFRKRLDRDRYFSACLVVIEGNPIGEKVSIDRKRMIIGRYAGSDIPIEDPLISKKHAEIAIQSDDQVVFRDLQSTNGVYINNVPVAQAVLKDGDLIRLGETVFKYIAPSSIENQYVNLMSEKATLDGLTGIFNKQAFHDYLAREFKRCRLLNEPLTVMILDLDFFKKVNDKMGHPAGDYTLKEIAGRLNKTFRRSDLFARYGGEEFGLILPHTDIREASTVAERIRASIEGTPLTYQETSFSMTASIGAAELDKNIKDPQELIALADKALYRAKHQGRNRVAIHGSASKET